MQLAAIDEKRLLGVKPELVRVIRQAVLNTPVRFRVLEGVRTLQRQRHLLAIKATRTLNSRHLTGHAVDIAPMVNGDQVSWHWPHYYPLAEHIKATAVAFGIDIDWGGDWPNFRDGPHWELSWSRYPLSK